MDDFNEAALTAQRRKEVMLEGLVPNKCEHENFDIYGRCGLCGRMDVEEAERLRIETRRATTIARRDPMTDIIAETARRVRTLVNGLQLVVEKLGHWDARREEADELLADQILDAVRIAETLEHRDAAHGGCRPAKDGSAEYGL